MSLFVALMCGMVSAQTVTNTNDAGPGSLRDEITNAVSGATITVDPSLAGQTVTLTSGTVSIGVDMTLIGADGFVVSGNSSDEVLDIPSGVTISASNLIIADGQTTNFGRGGAFTNQGTANFSDCTIRNNVGFNAAGIDNRATLNLNRCTFSNNSTSGNSGAAIANNSGATLTITNCTFSGNSCTGNGVGGAISQFSAASTTIVNSTFTGNSGAAGGAIYVAAGTISLLNTIVVGNTGGSSPNIDGTIVSQGNNLIGLSGGATITGGTNDIIGVPFNLGPLAANGGLTQTHALLAGGPGIDSGNPTGAPAFDQRGYTRSGTLDRGAFEFNGQAPTVTAVPTLSQWGLIMLGLVILCLGGIVVFNQQRRLQAV